MFELEGKKKEDNHRIQTLLHSILHVQGVQGGKVKNYRINSLHKTLFIH